MSSTSPPSVRGERFFSWRSSMCETARNVQATVDDDAGSVMILFRARYQMFDFIDEFVGMGIPFQVMTDGRMWTDRLADYVAAIEAIEAGEPVDGLQARRLADMLVDSAFGSNERDDLFSLIDDREEAADTDDLRELSFDPDEVSDIAPFVPGPGSAADMIRKVTSVQEKSLRAYFVGEYRDVAHDRVRVGTIHSAKGREADHVFVGTDLTEKVVEQMSAAADPVEVPAGIDFSRTTDPVPVLTDNERRVFYVGMSRARERLVVMENLIGGAPTLPIDVLICNEPREIDLKDLLEETLALPMV